MRAVPTLAAVALLLVAGCTGAGPGRLRRLAGPPRSGQPRGARRRRRRGGLRADDPGAGPGPLHQGFRAGVEWFRGYFRRLGEYGVDHVLVGMEADEPERALTTFAEEVVGER